MNNDPSSEPVDYAAKLKVIEEDNEKLKQALTEVSRTFNLK